MSASNGWSVDPSRLDEALGIWIRDCEPDAATREAVMDWTTDDLGTNPMFVGTPDDEGVWFTRVEETNTGISYVLDDERLVVFVSNIR